MSKKFKCPKCGNLTDSIIRDLYGNCIEDVNGDIEPNEYESIGGYCDECGYSTRNSIVREDFDIVEVEDD